MPCVREMYQSWSEIDAIVTVAEVSPFGCVSTMVLLRALPKCESGRGTS